MLLQHFIAHVVNRLYLESYVSGSISKIFLDFEEKLNNFETIKLYFNDSNNLTDLTNNSINFTPGQERNLPSSRFDIEKEVIMLSIIYDILVKSEHLLEDVTLLDLEWENTNKIFDQFTSLMSKFETVLNKKLHELVSLSRNDNWVLKRDSSFSASDKKPSVIAISANLVKDDRYFKTFYEDFSTLVHKNTSFETSFRIEEWFESERLLLKILRPFSSNYFIQISHFDQIALLADSIFWFSRKLSEASYRLITPLQDRVLTICKDILSISAQLMLTLRLEVKLRVLSYFDPSKRLDSEQGTLSYLVSTIEEISNQMPKETAHIIFWGFGYYLRFSFLEYINNISIFPTISEKQVIEFGNQVMLLGSILRNVEPDFVKEIDKLAFFCEFMCICLKNPDSILKHAKETNKLTYFEYSVLLNVAHRNLGWSEENTGLFKSHIKEMESIFE
ncbi:MAG: hypothetical protein MHPSP_000954 [Paramarteilia canceri]